jgi:iron complex outermembrane receptor protein
LTPSWRVQIHNRFRASLRQRGDNSLNFSIGKVPAVAYTALNITRVLGPNTSAYLNIQNLFDTSPPVFASSAGSIQMNYLGGFAQGDDIEGRYLTIGLRARF